MRRLVQAVIFLLLPCTPAIATSLPAIPLAASVAAKAGSPTLVQGELGGVPFAIARPASWNRRLLLLAHGSRPESAPLLADLSLESFAYKTLLDEGWMVATTSFRRNGIIIGDAIADLDALRAYIVDKYGVPQRVLLEGESMGGLIVTLLAEREPEVLTVAARNYDGAVAIGAALDAREPNSTIGLTLQPGIPIIFLTNQSELEGPKLYVSPKIPHPITDAPRPVIFYLTRNGHVNVNQRERLEALRALNLWLDRGPAALPRPAEGQPFFDATIPLAPQPSQVARHADGRGFDARITEVSPFYGNVELNAQPDDFAAVGIVPWSWFELKVGDRTQRIRYGRDFDSVKRGEWVAYPQAEGFCWIARSYDSAAATLGMKPGDIVTLRRYDDPKEAEPNP
jgi:pimeloyl-ACP methyl ester carboxylesterase